ncbi:MAG: hypothetical protein JNG88_04540 [Phycisphaerales bacterium]|nr:hypothetical protein [Phycisphaerales bacterium]
MHWWSKAGYGATTDANAPPAWRGGAAIAKIQGVRCVFVCGRDPDNSYIPTLYAFRFYPCDAAYDPTMTEAPALAKIALAPATEQINSTPLILPSDRIVVQTTKRVLCYDFSNALTFNPNNCALQSPPLIWQYYPTDGFVSEAASPALGYANNQGEPGMRTSHIFVAGNLKRLPEDGGGALEHRATLVALDPLTGTGQNPFVWQANLDDGFTQAAVTPAIGPIDGDSALRNFVYVATFGNSSTRNFFACYSDNSAAPLWADLGGTGEINGSFASASIHGNGDVIIPGDDGEVHAFDNVIPAGSQLTERAAERTVGEHCSATAGVFPDRHCVLWEEGNALNRIDDTGPTIELAGSRSLQFKERWVHGAPALDATNNWYVNTLGQLSAYPDYRKVMAFRNAIDGSSTILKAWQGGEYIPPQLTIGGQTVNLRQKFEGQVAMDEDGTLVVCNRGYVLALNPFAFDFSGNGVIDDEDIDAFALALTAEPLWRTGYGDAFGVNRLGVGDCNHDGVFDALDIDCFESRFPVAYGRCAYGAPGDGEGADRQDEMDWDRFLETMTWLRNYFDSH